MSLVTGWKLLDQSAIIVDSPISTGVSQQLAANVAEALETRTTGTSIVFDADDPQLLFGPAGAPLFTMLEIEVEREWRKLRLTPIFDALDADVTVWASVVTPGGLRGRYSEQTISPGVFQSADFEIDVAGLDGPQRFAICATSEDVGEGHADSINFLPGEVLQVEAEFVLLDNDPGMSASKVYIIRFDDNGGLYDDRDIPADRLVLGQRSSGGNFWEYVWPLVDREFWTGWPWAQPDYFGKQGGFLIPIGYLKLWSVEAVVIETADRPEPVENFRAGLPTSATKARLLAARTQEHFRTRTPQLVCGPPIDRETVDQTATRLSPSQALIPFDRSGAGSWKMIAAAPTIISDYRRETDTASDTYSATWIVSGVLGLVGGVRDAGISLKVELEDVEDGGALVSFELEDTIHLQSLDPYSNRETAEENLAWLLAFWADPAGYRASYISRHTARGLMPAGLTGAQGLVRMRLAPFRLSVTESQTSDHARSLRLYFKETPAAVRGRDARWLWCPVWSAHVRRVRI